GVTRIVNSRGHISKSDRPRVDLGPRLIRSYGGLLDKSDGRRAFRVSWAQSLG
ncbi:hypothetical protein PIB30_060812, partial [Stylosanthes scabra]|nr:hypothetical protein [Stylosanthes scabra]